MKTQTRKLLSLLLALITLLMFFAGCAQSIQSEKTQPSEASPGTQSSETPPDTQPSETSPGTQPSASPDTETKTEESVTDEPKEEFVVDLMANITPRPVTGLSADDAFISAQMDFAVRLLQEAAAQTGGSPLVSPLSTMLALSMTANGAAGTTREEMEKVLGGTLSLEELNEYLCAWLQATTEANSNLKSAQAIYFRDDPCFVVKQDFLQINADYYAASAKKAPFDASTIKEINDFVKENTKGRIEKIIDKINPLAVMYLVNALSFDGNWELPFISAFTREETFTAASGEKETVQMMYGDAWFYLSDGQARGFIKPFKSQYSFAALMPDEGIDIYDYLASLDGKTLLETLKNSKVIPVSLGMPKYKKTYDISLVNALKNMGMVSAFADNADFSGISESLPLNISEVLHKTSIEVSETGVKAGAATIVEVDVSAVEPQEHENVTLDRPFIYMILDKATNIPIFIGVVDRV